MMKEKEYLNVLEFADKVGLHPNSVRAAIRGGMIQAFRPTGSNKGHYRIDRSEVKRIQELNMMKLISDITSKDGK